MTTAAAHNPSMPIDVVAAGMREFLQLLDESRIGSSARTLRARDIDQVITQIGDWELRRAGWLLSLVERLRDDLMYMDAHGLCHACGWPSTPEDGKSETCHCRE